MGLTKVTEKRAVITCKDVSAENIEHIKKVSRVVFGIKDKDSLDRIENELAYSGRAFIQSGSFDMIELKLKITKYYFVNRKISTVGVEMAK